MDKRQKKTYEIKCTEEHLKIIAKSLEMYSRMKCGQINLSFLPPLNEKSFKLRTRSNSYDLINEVESHLQRIKKILFDLEPSESYGIRYNSEADFLYETYKTILYQFEKEEQIKCLIIGVVYNHNVHSEEAMILTNNPRMRIDCIERSILIEKKK